MTYLNLVNNVLRRLREDEVTNVSESTYSKMVGDFVNDAKKLVENAWDWSALRSTLTITTAADDYTYSLTGSGNQGRVFRIINDTSNCELRYQTQAWFDNEFWCLLRSFDHESFSPCSLGPVNPNAYCFIDLGRVLHAFIVHLFDRRS